MMNLILLGLLGSVVTGSLIYEYFDEDDSSSDKDEAQDLPPTPEEGLTLSFDGSEILSGASGDDTLPLDQNPELAPAVVDLKAGDDTASVEHPFGIEVLGGEGDDTLSSIAVGNFLAGGDGDDTLYGIDANQMYGGDGNDIITFDSDVEYNSDVARIDGGDGDDTINIFADAGVDLPDRGGAIVTGGEGSDDFNITLDLQDSQLDLDGGGTPLESTVCVISDFDPDEDALDIRIETEPENADRGLSVKFEQTETDGVYTTYLDLTFAETATALEAVTTIKLISDEPFTSEHIAITML